VRNVVTIDDSADGRSVFSEIERFCHARGIPVHVAASKRSVQSLIDELSPDLCVVVGWYWLFDAQTLRSVPRGVIGVHNSALPQYRGGAPLVWQMINGETRAGFSVFSLAEGIDDGAIWAQSFVPIDSADYVADVLCKLEHEVPRVFGELYPRILNGSVVPTPQSEVEVSYCAQRLPDDGRIDWRGSAETIYNFIRAQAPPYPGAFTMLGDRRLTILRAEPFDGRFFGRPGQVARVTSKGVCVCCGGNTAITVTEIACDGSLGGASTFLRSTAIRL
jgi:methionyl-tRNA formyltransferase